VFVNGPIKQMVKQKRAEFFTTRFKTSKEMNVLERPHQSFKNSSFPHHSPHSKKASRTYSLTSNVVEQALPLLNLSLMCASAQ
jgi:hypothetical protein